MSSRHLTAAALLLLALGAWAQGTAPNERRLLVSASPYPLAQNPESSVVEQVRLLRQKVARAGSLPVIVGVRSAHAPEGFLTADQARAQRADHAAAQASVRRKLEQAGPLKARSFSSVPYLSMAVDPAQLELLLTLSEVISIEEDVPVPPSLPQSVPLINADDAWAAGHSGSGYAVAILDTGTELNHPFFAGKIIAEGCYGTTNSSQGATSLCPGGNDSTAAGSSQRCSIGGCDHGTHVAGIAAGAAASAGRYGVARGANIISMQVFSRFDSSTSCGSSTPCVLSYSGDQIAALDRVNALVIAGTKVASVNMSLGGGQYTATCDTNALKASIDNLRSRGVATVIASGNSGYASAIAAPACISTAVSVGSTWDVSSANSCSGWTDSGGVDRVACYSNSASILDLLAPGSSIESAVFSGAYGSKQGTSMAAPHVAGCWAILKAAKPAATVTEIEDALKATGVAVTDFRNGIVKPRIDCKAALDRLLGSGGGFALTVTRAGAGSGAISSAPSGISCGSTCQATFASGTSVTLTATASAGSVFAGWSGGVCSGTGSCVVSMSAARSVTATFNALPSYTLGISRAGTGAGTVTSSPSGINCGSTCSASFSSGTSVTLSASAATGSAFAGWSGGGCSGTGSCVVSMTAARTVTATFNAVPSFVLTLTRAGAGSGTVTSLPTGISCGTSCSASYTSGTSVTLTAAAASGSSFAGWSGGVCSGTSPSCVVSMSAARSVTATFNVIPVSYTLLVGLSGTGSGTVASAPSGISCGASCSASYVSGTSVTLTATAAAGSTFAGWAGGVCSGTGNCTVSMTAARSVTAVFNSNSSSRVVALALTGLSGASGSVANYSVAVPAGAAHLVVTLSGGSGDADLHLRAGSAPDGTEAGSDCRSYTSTNNEACTIPRPAAATHFLRLEGYSAYTGVSLLATYEMPQVLQVGLAGTGQGTVASTAVSGTFESAVRDVYDPKIVGGSPSAAGSWPWQVQLSFSGGWTCGGSILSADWIVTAAHCVEDGGSIVAANTVTVRAGATAWGSGTVRTVSQVIAHSSYSPSTYDNDIALLRLSTPLTFGSSIGAVEPLLAADEATLAANGIQGTVTGWGTTSSGGSGSSLLRQVTLPMISTASCKLSAYGSEITDNMICAGLGTGEKDSCQGDSGGPLVVPNRRGGWLLAGVVSWGEGCAQASYPGVYSRVSRYTAWLTQHTGLSFGGPLISCGARCTAQLGLNSQVTLAATPATGSTFAGWSGACSGTGSCTVAMSAARSVTATFNAAPVPTFALSVTKSGTGAGAVTSSPAGINCSSGTCTASFAQNSSVTLSAAAGSGAAFAGWSGACTGTSSTCVVAMSAAKSTTATFDVARRLSIMRSGKGLVTSAPAGIRCGSALAQTGAQCTGTFALNSSVVLTAAADLGYRFAGWRGSCSGTSTSCTVAMSASRSVIATFVEDGTGLTAALDDTLLSWRSFGGTVAGSGSSLGWTSATVSGAVGGTAAASGNITHNEFSAVETVVTGPGLLTFNWKVSSEANRDWLSFNFNGSEQSSISGELGWLTETWVIPDGAHTLQWRYAKDQADVDSAGSNRAWLDNVKFTQGTAFSAGRATGRAAVSNLPIRRSSATGGAPRSQPGN